jgi:hypothetical protein
VQLIPDVGHSQQVSLELVQPPEQPGLKPPGLKPPGLEQPALPRAASSAQVEFSFVNVPPGDYLVRARVDGAQTEFNTDSAGVAYGPKVVIL